MEYTVATVLYDSDHFWQKHYWMEPYLVYDDYCQSVLQILDAFFANHKETSSSENGSLPYITVLHLFFSIRIADRPITKS